MVSFRFNSENQKNFGIFLEIFENFKMEKGGDIKERDMNITIGVLWIP